VRKINCRRKKTERRKMREKRVKRKETDGREMGVIWNYEVRDKWKESE
jgi:hypothetical protein